MESYTNYYSSGGGGLERSNQQQQQYHHHPHAPQRTLHAPIHNSCVDGGRTATNNVEFVVQQHNFDPGPPTAAQYPHEYVTYAAGNHYYDYNGYSSGVMNITANPAYDQPELLNGTPYSAYRSEYRSSSSGYEQAAVVRQLQEKFSNGGHAASNGQAVSNNGKAVVYDEDSFDAGRSECPNVRPGTISEGRGSCGSCLDAIFCSGQEEQNGFEDTAAAAENGPDVSAVAQTKVRTAGVAATGGGGESDEEMLRNSDYIKSVWIHCRLPLLILLFSALLILFFLFSGALIYLKC